MAPPLCCEIHPLCDLLLCSEPIRSLIGSNLISTIHFGKKQDLLWELSLRFPHVQPVTVGIKQIYLWPRSQVASSVGDIVIRLKCHSKIAVGPSLSISGSGIETLPLKCPKFMILFFYPNLIKKTTTSEALTEYLI